MCVRCCVCSREQKPRRELKPETDVVTPTSKRTEESLACTHAYTYIPLIYTLLSLYSARITRDLKERDTVTTESSLTRTRT